jgi:predicted amidophosphoribosyltransferase
MTMSRNPHICPNCGARVSAFAAGCAVCGAWLDPRRAEQPPTIARRIRRRLSTQRGQNFSAGGR